MKILLIAFALFACTVNAQLPDSATQGPNPQDIATPEPEYIDIDVPEPAGAPAPAPAPAPIPIQTRSFAPIPFSIAHPVQRPLISAAPVPQISHHYSAPQRSYSVPGHTFSSQNGYQYRRPVYIRRVYRRRRY